MHVTSNNLKQKAVTGILWSFFDKGGTQLIQFVIGIYIARILSPEDYGLVGLIMVFIIVSKVLVSSGFGSALIQKGNQVTQIDYDSVFLFNVLMSLLIYAILYFAAPSIAMFYDEPKLIPITRIMSISLIFTSLGMTQITILTKIINFKTIAKINLIAILLSTTLGLVLAFLGFGVWALVIIILGENVIKTTLVWIFNTWRPTFNFSFKAIQSLFNFGSKLLISNLITQLNNSIYSLIIGKFYSINEVGFFSQAKKIQERVGYTVNGAIQSTIFPSYALIKDDKERFKNAIQTNIKVTTLIVFPMLSGLIVIADPFVYLFLTEKWMSSVTLIQVLSLGGVFFVLNGISTNAIIISGKVKLVMKITIYSNILFLIIILFCLFLKVSLIVLIAGKSIWLFIDFILFFLYFKKEFNFKFLEYMRDLSLPLLFSIIMAISVFIIGDNFSSTSWTQLITQISSGIFIYLFLNLLFNKKFIFTLLKK